MADACELPQQRATADEIQSILATARVIAVIGLSDKPARDSHRVAAYLQQHGYRIIPVNPNVSEVLGEKAYPRLTDVPSPVDVVDIFRRPEAVPEIVDDAIRIGAKAVWMQDGIVHNSAAAKARAAGLRVVMNQCMLREHRRLKADATKSDG
jgi:predicted CoA-binding protein